MPYRNIIKPLHHPGKHGLIPSRMPKDVQLTAYANNCHFLLILRLLLFWSSRAPYLCLHDVDMSMVRLVAISSGFPPPTYKSQYLPLLPLQILEHIAFITKLKWHLAQVLLLEEIRWGMMERYFVLFSFTPHTSEHRKLYDPKKCGWEFSKVSILYAPKVIDIYVPKSFNVWLCWNGRHGSSTVKHTQTSVNLACSGNSISGGSEPYEEVPRVHWIWIPIG